MPPVRSALQSFGLHPLAAAGLIAIDAMLFGAESASAGTALILTVPAGFMLGIATALLQRHSYGDAWGPAIGKGLVLGVLTAIPTPLPSLVTGASGVMGFIKLLRDRHERPPS